MKITKKLQIFLLLSIAAALVSSGDKISSEHQTEKNRKMDSPPSHDEESVLLSERSFRSAGEKDMKTAALPYDSDEESEKAGLNMSDSSENMSDLSDADKTVSPVDTQHVSVVTEVDNTSENPSYVGNRSSKVFHVPECSAAVKTGSKNKVTFLTSEEALSKGFTPCKNWQTVAASLTTAGTPRTLATGDGMNRDEMAGNDFPSFFRLQLNIDNIQKFFPRKKEL